MLVVNSVGLLRQRRRFTQSTKANAAHYASANLGRAIVGCRGLIATPEQSA